LRVFDQRRHRAPRDHEAAERRQRHGNGDEKHHGLSSSIRLVEPQPEVNANTTVQPHDHEKRALKDGALRPEPRQLVQVVVVDPENEAGDARIDDVRQQQERNRQSEQDLNEFPGGEPKSRAVRQLHQGERHVRYQCSQQHERAGPGARDHPSPLLHRVHCLEVNEPKRRVEEVRGCEREQDQSGANPQPLGDVATEQDVHLGATSYNLLRACAL
jgi:hypothetical protein